MIETCNKNARMYRNLAKPNDPIPIVIPPYCEVLARLCALCHDMAHVPFGHTLEKEGGVFQADEWQDPDRFNRIFGHDSDFFRSVVDFLHGKRNQFEVDKTTGRYLLDLVGKILKTKKQSEDEKAKKDPVDQLPFPFVHDLVGNTICADLIDYIQRDMYFCGLAERFGDRFIEYLAVLPTTVNDKGNRYATDMSEARGNISRDKPTAHDLLEGGRAGVKYRLVLLQYRYNEKRIAVEKHDVVAEAIDLVRKRLAVAEKLYYHRTKVAGSSMLIAAAHEVRLTAASIKDLSDAQVLEHLEKSKFKRARVLAQRIRTRRLFKPLFRASFHEKDESAASKALWDERNGALN
jgi:HD superfamily phosphohydrolase